MDQPALALTISPTPRRRGRPRGARSRRSIDLAKYVEAVFGGMTPGQQSARLCLVTAKELKAAGGDLTAAMVTKARDLALELGCDPRDAWLLLQKEREQLMPYVHQKRPPAAEVKDDGMERVVIIDDTVAPVLEFTGDFDDESLQVAQPKSDDTA